ncbi:MAG: dTDP-4-dehydrorhamnose reductase [Rhodospirillales bacterium 69-11]|nr:dTDP-4-dehydrorhamnose reductase [Rhodospirillales bacterium]MBN8925625.1 dTDP-4-dehydrorhamnose reductase [Rhodospirillales bacterium]OJW31282.1 MAG: dTDP-4-dehydrorhamnose reductase [Rhodospirillales bacterium 69-11]
MGPILVTGGTGQLARALDAAAPDRVRRVGRPDFDFDRPETLDARFAAIRPALVVNAAAYTAVDAAEDDAEAAYRANRDGPATLARLCAEAGIPLIHVSTDYVFDGAKGAPYVETDPVSPQGVYGASKLAGEQAVLASDAQATILRTSWVYAAEGKNFVRTMLTVGATRDRLTVVADQRGCPTTAADLAAAILAIADRIAASGWRPDYGGVFHAAGSGETTWFGLATATFEEAARHGAKVPEVAPIATADWPTKARRPADSRLDCGKLDAVFGIRLPPWRDSLVRTIDAIYAQPRG